MILNIKFQKQNSVKNMTKKGAHNNFVVINICR